MAAKVSKKRLARYRPFIRRRVSASMSRWSRRLNGMFVTIRSLRRPCRRGRLHSMDRSRDCKGRRRLSPDITLFFYERCPMLTPSRIICLYGCVYNCVKRRVISIRFIRRCPGNGDRGRNVRHTSCHGAGGTYELFRSPALCLLLLFRFGGRVRFIRLLLIGG